MRFGLRREAARQAAFMRSKAFIYLLLPRAYESAVAAALAQNDFSF
jgi:hypothetical protein